MTKTKAIFKEIWIYSAGTVMTQAIGVAAAVLTRRFLGPLQMGIWSTLQIVVNYSKYTTLGVMTAVAREVPYYLGKGDEAASRKVKNASFSFVIISSVLLALGLCAFAYFTRGRFSREITIGLCLVAAVVALQRFNNLMVTLLRSYKEFRLASELMILSALVNAFFIAVLAYAFKLYGFIFAMVLSLVFNIFYVQARRDLEMRWDFDLAAIRRLMKFGFPLMVIGVLDTLVKSLDRIVIAKFIGLEPLGQYSIALMVFGYGVQLATSFAVVLFPHGQERFGARDNPADLRRFISRSAEGYALVMPLVIAVTWIAGPAAVRLLLPKFEPGIVSMLWLSFGLFYSALALPFYDFLVTAKKHLRLFPVVIASGAVMGAAQWLAVRAGWGIEGVAAATALGYAVYFTAVYFAAAGLFSGMRAAAKTFLFYNGCLLWTAAVLVMNAYGLRDLWPEAWLLKNTAAFLAVAVPAAWLIESRYRVLTAVRERLSVRNGAAQ